MSSREPATTIAQVTDHLSVVIPTHDRARGVRDIVEALRGDATVGEVIIVDDCSGPETMQTLAALTEEDRRARVLRLDRNVGPAAARRLGVDAARSEVVLCLDDDVVPCPGATAGHLSAHRSGYEVVVGYMPVRFAAQTDVVVTRYQGLYEERVRQWETRPDLVLRSLWGGFTSFRRDQYLAADARCMGLRYHEDLELGVVLAQLQARAVYDPSIRAEHRHARSVRATLADNRVGGEAIAVLERRHPEHVSTEGWFSREDAQPLRRCLLRLLARPRPIAAIARLVGGAEMIGAHRWADRLLAAGSRANYYTGYVRDTAAAAG